MKTHHEELIECLKDGEMFARLWAEHWRKSPAYGGGQPDLHPTHQGVLDRFKRVIQHETEEAK